LTVVKAATYIDIDLKRWTKTPNIYWKWNQYQKASSLGIREALIAAVETRLVADTKVCTFLSGGIDSAIVSQIASKTMGAELVAFTLKVDGRGYDESQLAQKTARAIGIEINIVSKTFEDLAYDSLELLGKVDLPILDTSSILTYSLAKEVSKEYKVALTGDGGDELFMGYELFKYYNYLELLRRRIPGFGAFALNRIIPILFTQTDYLPIKMKFERLRFILEHPDIPTHISAISPVGGTELADFLSRDASFGQDKKQSTSIDLATYYRNFILPEVYLLKTDRASMLNGLELRAPFLDSELIYFANREILMERKMGNKTFLRNYASTFLPVEVLNSPKHGFSAPFGKIMEFLDEPRWNNYFPSELAKLASITWQNGRMHGGNSANAAWCLLNMTSLHDKFLFGPA
jgi:asparagine synthase (glutamine-hydrolysing)